MAFEKVSTGSHEPSSLKVIIVGGSIAGLTLARSLYHARINYVLLEAASDIAPQAGASIAMSPNAPRILDQLGIYKEFLNYATELRNEALFTAEGKQIAYSGEAIEITNARFGYPPYFIQRRHLLEVLSHNMPGDSKILTGKRVSRIEHSDAGVTVSCEDGTSYAGDIVAGADGIHSVVRKAMQKHLNKLSPGAADKDIKGISAEFNCIFGYAEPIEGANVKVGDCRRSYGKGRSTLVLVGDDLRLYFFMFHKLDRRYWGDEIPRYSKADLDREAKKLFDVFLDDHVTFKQVWEQRLFATMTPLEESQNEHWTSERFVCVGDSIHKMTPNLGSGGVAALESAVALANSLAQIQSRQPTLDDIRKALTNYQTKRSPRVHHICKEANGLTRLEALHTLAHKLLAFYAFPHLEPLLIDGFSSIIIGAESLDFLPLPERGLGGTMPWDREAGIGKTESKWVRALYAVPILGFMYICRRTMHASLAGCVPALQAAVKSGQLALGNGLVVPIRQTFYGIKGVDEFLGPLVTAFTPSISDHIDASGRMQMIAFLADLAPIQAIWSIESIRRGNFLTAASLVPTFMGVWYQLQGIGFVAPLYYFLHYVQSPLENYAAADNRMTNIAYAKTLLPTITTTYILPTVAMFVAPSLSTRQWINGALWQPFPLISALVHRLLARTAVTDTTTHDSLHNPRADLPYLRATYRATAAFSAAAYLYVRWASPTPLRDVFFAAIRHPTAPLSLAAAVARSLRYDQLTAFAAGALWTGLSFADLKRARRVTAGWMRVLGVFAGTTLLAGPGAAMAVMWSWREEALAGKVEVPVQKRLGGKEA